ncbi:MAG: glycosyltransferase [Lachnospiraceae bacterium]|nr:glycosyltransferase [Lachnospiraceae bacterium]
MAIKDRVRGILIGRQDRQYEKRLEELRETHDRWERGRELFIGLAGSCTVRYFGDAAEQTETESAPAGAEGASDVEIPCLLCVLYTDIEKFIESGALLKCEDSEIVIFARKEGRLSASAAPLIYRWFTEHPTGKLVYGDEDVLLPDGSYDQPYFKPDWSPDTYLSSFYVGSVFAVRGSVLKNALLHAPAETLTEEQKKTRGKLLSGLADALFLKVATAAGGFLRRRGEEFPVGHIGEILFHLEEGRDLFHGRKYPTAAVNKSAHFLLPMSGMPEDVSDRLVSIIIPTKDHPDILKKCLDSIAETCDSSCPYEIIIVDNGSTGYNKLLIANFVAKMPRTNGLTNIRYIHQPMEFNFSRMCNLGAQSSKGGLLLFLNDDITAESPGWLKEMTLMAVRPYVGAVGAKLLYPEQDPENETGRPADPRDGGYVKRKIQHAGVTNVRLGPMHKLQYLSDEKVHYFGFNRGIHDLLGVTGACLMIGREKYEAAGGLPEDMAVAFNDVDLCYTLYEQGFYNVQCNHVMLRHHESLSRGLDTLDQAKMERLAGEHRILMGRHEQLYNIDPFYSPHLVEDEHISDITPLYEVTEPEELPFGNLSHHTEGLKDVPVDPVLRVGVEYCDTLEYWITGKRGDAATGYYLKGYAFVIGADNACYDRRLLLRRLVERDTADGTGKALVPDADVWSLPANDWYRPDIRDRLADQIHVDLTGYRVRLEKEALPEGLYQIGMLAIDKTSRQRLVNWVENRMWIGPERAVSE